MYNCKFRYVTVYTGPTGDGRGHGPLFWYQKYFQKGQVLKHLIQVRLIELGPSTLKFVAWARYISYKDTYLTKNLLGVSYEKDKAYYLPVV